MITAREVDQAYSDLWSVCGGVKEDYFGLAYLEREHKLEREQAIHQIAFGGHDYGVDGFHFDPQRRNLYIYQFKFSNSAATFKGSFERLLRTCSAVSVVRCGRRRRERRLPMSNR